MTAPTHPPLLAPEVLAAMLGRDRLVILDIRSSVDGGGRAAYEAGHVPGAIHSDYGADGWRVPAGAAPGMLPPRERIGALLGDLGITPSHHVVICSAGTSATDFAASARVFWTFKVVGHQAVSILDGGFRAWSADPGRPVESGVVQPLALTPYPVAYQSDLRSTADATLVAIRGRLATPVDARATSYFEGREKVAEAARPGRIPGALSHDHVQSFDTAAGVLKPVGDLVKLFADVPNGPVISYCNTGHTAATNWFVLSQLLGREEVSLYDGSMTDWTQDETRPVAVGPAS